MLFVVLLLYTDQCFYYIVQLIYIDAGRLNKKKPLFINKKIS